MPTLLWQFLQVTFAAFLVVPFNLSQATQPAQVCTTNAPYWDKWAEDTAIAMRSNPSVL